MPPEAVEQHSDHLGVAEDVRPFSQGEIGRGDNRGALVETAEQVEQQLRARLRERLVAQFVQGDEVEAREIVSSIGCRLPGDWRGRQY